MELNFFILVILLLFGPSVHAYRNTKYNTTAGIVSGKINVHLVPHTHDDVGWLKTVDQYYVGSQNAIQEAGVQYILDSVIDYLTDNPDRKFVYVEQAFFQRWWNQQPADMQAVVKSLVTSGQLEFINGGWCMHDEAATHYIDMIDQTTLGHKFLKEQFGVIPRIGWQIDPFGHSAVQAYLLSAELGFDALFFARIDYQDRQQRYADKTLEVIWQGSNTFGSDSQVFTSIFPVHYGPPDGHGFAYEESDEIPIQDDPSLFDYNLQERIDSFVIAAQVQANISRTNHVMWTMGNDFKYALAGKWFVQMDKFIHYVNLDGRVNALYSTPSKYLDAVNAANATWPLKFDDFFPYADNGNSYWTGYFTSRPGLKGYVRELSSFLQAARQLEFHLGRNESGPNTDSLWDALSIAQHHDAVSGTEKQHVADDYAARLAIGAAESEELITAAVTFLANVSANGSSNATTLDSFVQCPLINVSYCPTTEAFLTGQTLVVTVYNPLGWIRTEYIRIPINEENVTVTDASGNSVPSQLLPMDYTTQKLRFTYVQAQLGISPSAAPLFWLTFPVEVPPLGLTTYFVNKVTVNSTNGAANTTVEEPSGGTNPFVIGFESTLTFSPDVGFLTQMSNANSSIDIPVQQAYYGYTGYAGDGQCSGAYIFLPDSSGAQAVEDAVGVTILRGPLVQELHQDFSSWIHQVFRMYKGVDHAEVEFVIGPIPEGQEVVTRYTTSIPSNGTFYTDSNGRDFIKRVRDFRSDWTLEVTQPVAGNYYPVNLGIYLNDGETDFSILVDRAVGGGSIADGQLELMLHRRLVADDGRGVNEALNEVICLPQGYCGGLTIKGKSYFNVNPVDKAARWRRIQGQKTLFPLQLFFGLTENVASATSFSAVAPAYVLPDNIGLITLQALTNGDALVRLAHLYEAGEDDELSQSATVDLTKLFPTRTIQTVTELSLSGNQPKANIQPMTWNMESPGLTRKAPAGWPLDGSNNVEIGAMEIRTLEIKFAS